MERALKERIIGAVVLVIFVVLIVPIFLDGPPQEGEIVSERVLLPGQDAQDTNTVILERGRSEPIPVANSAAATDKPEPDTSEPDTSKPADEPVASRPPADATPVVQKPAKTTTTEQSPPPAAVQKPAPETAAPELKVAGSSTGMWAVQLGSFSSKDNAEKLAADLRKQGYAAFLSQLQANGKTLHRVRIGPQKDRQGAEEMAARLARVGHKGQVVPHP